LDGVGMEVGNRTFHGGHSENLVILRRLWMAIERGEEGTGGMEFERF
jgi:hypothetical protein